jgi:hypothetical protein
MSNDKMEQLIELFHEEACLCNVNDMNYMNGDSKTAALGNMDDILKMSVG